ncbi:anti-ECFsigma factor, ChrR [[Leptolyngbya] sp. PCC 7376]|uniref:cupin domain-containing protein n=1 Tax=[Leptolyngbya] sp. PCC 7376 TaxID=111781 RepID=UPI00029EEE79|nr:cupin domain-containing protein [[Leptolyngbya] sp. PCC 7376]AFY39344.1 anti-ECFsigma factor, ChrR [[Leptolyngbya] sp. PCC 7376]
MKINADFNQRVVLETNQLDWQDSPMQGVRRRMLDRDGAEVARATSLVKYEPGSYFTAHTHGGGEEFFVVEGTFSDEHGDYSAGTYVRNPVDSSHAPFSKDGCTIFVKLWQMSPEDDQQKAINTNTEHWLPGMVQGLSVLPLHAHGTENVALVKWEPGTKFQTHRHWGGEEILVLEGTFADEQGIYPKGTWLRNPPNSIHTPFSDEGCIIYVKTGHLS